MSNQELIKNYRSMWTSFVKLNYFPTLLKNVKIIDFEEFKNNVYHDEKKLEK